MTDSYLQEVFQAHLKEHDVKRLEDLPKHVQEALKKLAKEKTSE